MPGGGCAEPEGGAAPGRPPGNFMFRLSLRDGFCPGMAGDELAGTGEGRCMF